MGLVRLSMLASAGGAIVMVAVASTAPCRGSSGTDAQCLLQSVGFEQRVDDVVAPDASGFVIGFSVDDPAANKTGQVDRSHAQEKKQCPQPLPKTCRDECPTSAVVTHQSTVTGTGAGTAYGEVFKYELKPASKFYCVQIREVVTTVAKNDGCNCNLPPSIIIAVNLCCDANSLFDRITNVVKNPDTPCPCATISTQELQCRPKDSTDDKDWKTFQTQELKWERLANADIRVTVTPMGEKAVSHTQKGPACPAPTPTPTWRVKD